MIAVVRGEYRRKSELRAVELQCTCLAIVRADNDGIPLFFRRQGVIDARHLRGQFMPSQPVGDPLRQRLIHFSLLDVERDAESDR